MPFCCYVRVNFVRQRFRAGKGEIVDKEGSATEGGNLTSHGELRATDISSLSRSSASDSPDPLAQPTQ